MTEVVATTAAIIRPKL